MKRSVGTLTKRRVAARAQWRCARCQSFVDEYYEIDHRVPLHLGGSNHFDNLDLLCWLCHQKKSRDERIHQEKWLSIGYCKTCHRTFSLYFGCNHLRRQQPVRARARLKEKILRNFGLGSLRTTPLRK